MRDIAVTLAVFGSLPFIIKRPWIGILVWTWLGFMNPHRLAWGFATTLPFAMVVALTTMLAMLMSKEEKKIPWTREMVLAADVLGVDGGHDLELAVSGAGLGPAHQGVEDLPHDFRHYDADQHARRG